MQHRSHRLWAALLLLVPFGLTSSGVSRAGEPGPPLPPPDPAIAFAAEKNFSQFSLMVMNADGSNQTLVFAGPRSSGHPDANWSPDGTQLVFASNIQGPGVYVINRDGTGLRKVVATNSVASGPAWSPVRLGDGQYKIAFTDAPAGRQDSDLFVVNLDGLGLVNLTNTVGPMEFHPSWDRFATRLAAKVFPDLAASQPGDVLVYQLGIVGGQVKITSQTNLTASGPLQDADMHRPDWAKTQDKIAVAVLEPGGDFPDIWVFDLNNPSSPVNITNTPGINENMPSWSFDDSKIAFRRTDRKPSIYTMNADGSGVTKIAIPPKSTFAFHSPDWRRNP